MTTGLAWNVANPLKPVALFDVNAIRDIPFAWVDWLADIDSTHASHEVICDEPLICTQSSELAGVIAVRVKFDPSGDEPVIGQKYRVTCRIVAADGQQDDQTLYLKATEK